MADLLSYSIRQLHDALSRKECTVKQVVDAYLAEIKKHNSQLNAYLEVYGDIDVAVARAQRRFDDGTATLLTGIPCAVKDNILIKGKKASAASKMLENYTAPYSATVIDRLQKDDMIFLGRVNMDEFAMGGSTENSAYGVTRNPHDPTRVPGGSSGGSAVAVAMKGALVALGSDTGGSIRQPASFTGCVGLKPTYGSVSRYGLMAMASSLDQIGPITRTVDDAEIMFNALRGVDPKDATTHIPAAVSSKRTKAIGVPFSLLEKGVDPDVRKDFDAALKKLEQAGYKIVDVSLPYLEYALAVYYIIMPAEVSSNMARFDGVRYGLHADAGDVVSDYFLSRAKGLGKEVRRRIMLGTYVLSSGYYDAYYAKAQAVQKLMTADFLKVFETVDAVVTPTSPVPAFKLGEKSDPLSMYLADIFTVSANLTRLPALSVPSGTTVRDSKVLPLGIQFMAPHYREDILFDIGRKFETIQ